MKAGINPAVLEKPAGERGVGAPDGLLTELKKRLINRVLESELTTHLGYEKHQTPPDGQTNTRNGHSSKTLRSDDGKLAIQIPRDRSGDFEPTLVPKHQRHFDGFDDAIISLYSRGLGVREIQQHLLEIYKVEVSTPPLAEAGPPTGPSSPPSSTSPPRSGRSSTPPTPSNRSTARCGRSAAIAISSPPSTRSPSSST